MRQLKQQQLKQQQLKQQQLKQKQCQFTPHEYDYDLVKRFLDYISNTALPKEKIREYKQLVKDYTIAVKLNKGPDIDRSIYWAKKARSIHRTMRKVLD